MATKGERRLSVRIRSRVREVDLCRWPNALVSADQASVPDHAGGPHGQLAIRRSVQRSGKFDEAVTTAHRQMDPGNKRP